jgi:hypothetical protein
MHRAPSPSKAEELRKRGRFACVAALTALASAGCATTYEPKTPHVAVVRGIFHHGYLKDGVYYPGGWFGGNVGEAVKGVPEAERHAEAYKTLSTVGSLCIFGSEAIGISASVVSATAQRGETRDNVSTGLIIGSITALVTGITLHFISEHHLYDAANIYNDELDRRKAAPVPAGGTTKTGEAPKAASKHVATQKPRFFTPWSFSF